MKNKLILTDINIQDFSFDDIDLHLNYWYRSPPDFMKSLKIDINKLPSERIMREILEEHVNNVKDGIKKSHILSIKHINKTIGVHELTHLTINNSAIMHAHIWNSDYRGIGIGPISYLLAMKVFFLRFNLKEIRFETPLHNISARKIKEKLGILESGFSTIDMPMLIEQQPTISYIVHSDDLEKIEKNVENYIKQRMV